MSDDTILAGDDRVSYLALVGALRMQELHTPPAANRADSIQPDRVKCVYLM